MNQMLVALKQAGIKTKPLAERVWQYIADHSKVSALTVGQVLKEPTVQVADACSKMTLRGMLHCESVLMRSKVGRGSGMRKINHYSVALPHYELLPVPPVSIIPAPVGFSFPPSCSQKDSNTPVQSVPEVKPPSTLDVNLMPLGEARALYEQLKQVFG